MLNEVINNVNNELKKKKDRRKLNVYIEPYRRRVAFARVLYESIKYNHIHVKCSKFNNGELTVMGIIVNLFI